METNQQLIPPASLQCPAPKTSLSCKRRRNNENALIYCAFCSYFLIDIFLRSREELDSALRTFSAILSLLEQHDATVSLEDANLKFLRSLPSVWYVVATMIRGQPGLDELEFDDLYNNLKHKSQRIYSTISSKVPTAPNCASHSDEIICSFFAQQASMPNNFIMMRHAASNRMKMLWMKITHSMAVSYERTPRIMTYAYDGGTELKLNKMNEHGVTQLDLSNHMAILSPIHEVLKEVYYPRMDNRRPRNLKLLTITRLLPQDSSQTTRPQENCGNLSWLKKGSTVGSQAELPQTGNPEDDLKDSAIIDSEWLWKYDKDTRHSVLILKSSKGDKECLILSPKFKFVDEDLVILRAPRKNDVYN
ncbi:hypothetical protein Tco_0953650 [Tanacetum coccineum]|uniref:Uncharacterized protein n=1 Tax=Tanacetum coccineum TaxID=301880 RepID=A0ABQ5E0K5_9ASTR